MARTRWLGVVSALIVAAGVLLSAPLFAQDNVCQAPADKALFACLRRLAEYTSWMVVPNNTVAPEKLQQAIDDAYKDLQLEWTGPLRNRTYLRGVYILVPSALFLYYLVVMGVQKRFPPVLLANDNPRWRVEKFVIIAGACGLIFVLVGERWLTYDAMKREYDLLRRAPERFVHLQTPHALVNLIDKPCDLLGGSDSIDILLASRCQEDWTRGVPLKGSRLLTSSFTDRALVKSRSAIGVACDKVVPLPAWFMDAGSGLFAIKMECPVFEAGEGVVKVGALKGWFSALRKWLDPKEPPSTLALENVFGGIDDTGQFVYRRKVDTLIGPDAYRGYHEQFFWSSLPWIGLGVVLLLVSMVTSLYWRTQELNQGSERLGQWLSMGLRVGVIVWFLAGAVMVLWMGVLG